MGKRLIAVLGVALMATVACGDSAPKQDAFIGNPLDKCQTVPGTVPGVSVLGKRIAGISDIKACVSDKTDASGAPAIKNQPDCGTPCFTVEIDKFAISTDAKVELTWSREGTKEKYGYDPEPIGDGPLTGRVCVIGVGTPDPCVDRITTPKNFKATGAKRAINLRWDAAIDTGGAALSGYEVWRSTTGVDGSFALHGTTTTSATKFTDKVGKSKTYWYYVVTVDGDGNRSLATSVAKATSRSK